MTTTYLLVNYIFGQIDIPPPLPETNKICKQTLSKESSINASPDFSGQISHTGAFATLQKTRERIALLTLSPFKEIIHNFQTVRNNVQKEIKHPCKAFPRRLTCKSVMDFTKGEGSFDIFG